MDFHSPFQTLGNLMRQKPGSTEIEALINLMPGAVFILDLNREIIFLSNSKAVELSAYTRAELTGLSIRSLFLFAEGNLTEIIRNNTKEIRLDTIRRGGSNIPCIASASCLNPSNAYYLLALDTVTSIEQRKQVHQQQDVLWKALQSLANAPLQPDVDAAVTMTLQACLNMTRADCLSLYQARNDVPQFRRKIQLGNEDPFPIQLSQIDIASLQGSSIWISRKRTTCTLHRIARSNNYTYLATKPIGDPKAIIGLLLVAGFSQPDPTYLTEVLDIITASISSIIQSFTLINQLQQEVLLQRRDQLITSILMSTVDEGVITLLPDLTIESLNRAAENCLGYTIGEVKSQSIYNILIGTEELNSAFVNALRGRNYTSLAIHKLYRRNGIAFPARLSLIPVINNDEMSHVLVIFQDLSEQEEYRARNQQLEQRALLGEVTASFAHEVRNPINNISTGLQLLAYNLPAEDPNQENIKRLLVDCERLADLVKSSLLFVRPLEYKLEPINIGSFLSLTLERWKPRLERNNIKPHLQVEDSLPEIEGDVRSLEQVMTNLINNAIQAMDGREGVLGLKARRLTEPSRPTQIEISVSDTGPGMPQEVRDRIFEPFFTTKQKGTGLGLAIVKRIITAHKGAITVHSVPGGTIFLISLPALRDNLMQNGES